MRIAKGSHIKEVNNLQVEEAHNAKCTQMIYLLCWCYLWVVSFHVLIIPQIVMLVLMSRNVERRNGKNKNNIARHDDDGTDQNVLECRYNNLTSFSIFIYCPYKAEDAYTDNKFIYMIFYVYKLRVTYSICFKCQSYQL